jgi:predicted metal-binding membrane protein
VGRTLTRTALTQVVAGASAVLAMSAAWLWLAGASAAHPHAAAWSASTLWTAIVMWQAMMVAMMTPAVAPWVGVYARLLAADGRGSSPIVPAVNFAGGYFAVWLLYSTGAALLQVSLSTAGLLPHGTPARGLAGAVLAAAGAFQFTPVKQACLSHCRNPLSYLLARWRGGPPGAFRLGVTHGAYCVGCCWILMLTGFAVGLMNLAWMALLTSFVAAEQLAPGGAWLGRLFGAALVAWGLNLWWTA